MSLKNEVFLQLLAAAGESVSGEELARRLNVSRAAVCKAVKALKEDGCDISSATRRGYALRSAGDKTDAESLSLELGMKVVHLDSVSSTNAYARGLEERRPALIIADSQTGGKARHKKEFPSPKNAGLYMSYLFFPTDSDYSPSSLTALAVQVVAAVTGGEARDYEVYEKGKKIAGVLAEVTADPDGAECAVIGIGVYTDGLSKSKRVLVLEIIGQLQKILR